MDRPRVVLTTTASVDGRVTPTRSERLLDPDVQARWRAAWPDDVEHLIDQRRQWLEERYSPTVVLEGSRTFVATDAVSPWRGADLEVAAADEALSDDFAPRPTRKHFVVVDGRGRMDWQFTVDHETSLVVLVCRASPTGRGRRHQRSSSLVTLRAQGLVQGARGSTWARYEVRR